MSEEIQQTKFEGWALVEVMGHRKAAGYVNTEFIGTAAFLRVVTPEIAASTVTLEQSQVINYIRYPAGTVLEVKRKRQEVLVGASSVYAITPIEESEVTLHAPLETTVISNGQLLLEEKSLIANRVGDDDEVPY